MAPIPPVQDIAIAIVIVLRILFLQLPLFLLTKSYHDVGGQSGRLYHGIPLNKLVEIFVIRSITKYLPITVTRYISDISLPNKVLKSPRYAPYASHLYQHVNEADFNGVWIIRTGFTHNDSPVSTINIDPSTSDIVIYYLHGGGYITNSTATYTVFLLRLAEVITRSGKSVSIFALEYDLAPEAVFPRQLVQARKAYDWLIGDTYKGGMGIDRERVMIMGDSAGGHLSLSLLVDLWRPLLVEGRGLTAMANFLREDTEDLRPGLGVVLLSPWLSLLHVPESFSRNALTDLIAQKFLYGVAGKFLGSDCQGGLPQGRLSWLEFVDGKSGIMWDEVLPEWVWVSAGRYEILYDDIVRWVSERREDCGGQNSRRIVGELDKDEVHDYAWYPTMDQRLRGQLCGTRMDEGEEFEEFDAIERVGRAILQRWEVLFGG